MNPSPVKIIVVHWKWQENLCYPRLYASPGQEANAKAGDPVSEFQWTYFQKGTVPFIPVYEKDSQENEQPVPDKRLLPTSLSKYLKLLDIETTPFPKFYQETGGSGTKSVSGDFKRPRVNFFSETCTEIGSQWFCASSHPF